MLVELAHPANGRRSRDRGARGEVADAQIPLASRQAEEDEHQIPCRTGGVDRREVPATFLPQTEQSSGNLAAFVSRQ
jgi:hypothetical protein